MTDVIQDFLDAMQSAGVNMDTAGKHPIADGRIHRAPALGKKSKRNLHVWYILHLDGVPAGAFGDYQLGIEDTWCAKKQSDLSEDERNAMIARAQATRAEREREQRELNKAAAEAAALIMAATGKADPGSPLPCKEGIATIPRLAATENGSQVHPAK